MASFKPMLTLSSRREEVLIGPGSVQYFVNTTPDLQFSWAQNQSLVCGQRGAR